MSFSIRNDQNFDDVQASSVTVSEQFGLPILPDTSVPTDYVQTGFMAFSESDNAPMYSNGQVWTVLSTGGTGTVSQVNTGTGLTGGPITTTGTISLANTSVVAGSYTYASFTVNAQGRLTAAASGTSPVTSVGTGTGLTGGPITSTGTISLANTAVTPGTYQYATLTVDQQGRITAASNSSTPIVNVSAGTGITVTGSAPAVTVGISNTGVVATSYAFPSSVTVNAQGQITAITGGSAPATGTVTSVGTGTGLTGGPITNTGTISLANTAVTPGSYTYASITVDQQGRLTSASSGTAPVTTVFAGTGITVTGTTTPTVSITNTTVTPGSYTYASITVNAQGQLTSASSGTAPVSSVSAGTGITITGTTVLPIVNIANTSVTPGSYTYASLTVDQQGRLTAASSGTSPVTSVTAGTGITLTGTSSAPIVNVANTAVTPGSYTYSSITVDQQGRLTAASSGTAPVTSVIAGAGITVTGTITPTVSITNTGVVAGTYTSPSIVVNSRGQITSASNVLTTKGDIWSNSGAFPVGSDGSVLVSAASAVTGLAYIPPMAGWLSNVGLQFVPDGGGAIISITTADGSSPAGNRPPYIAVRDKDVTIGEVQTIYGSTGIPILPGSTLGTTNNYQGYIYVYVANDSGTLYMAITLTQQNLSSLVNTVDIQGGSGASSATTVYTSLVTLTNVPLQYIGKIKAPQTTAGTWTAAATEIIVSTGSSFDSDPIMNSRGDLITMDSVNVPTRLALGSANTLLTSNGSDPSWNALNVNTSLLAGNGVASALSLAAGTANTFLASNGSATSYTALNTNTDSFVGNGVGTALNIQRTGPSLSIMQSQSIATGTTDIFVLGNSTVATWNNVTPSAGWNAATGTYTVQSGRAGWYSASFNANYANNTSGRRQAAIQVTTPAGTAQSLNSVNANAGTAVTGITAYTYVYLAVGDTIKFATQQSSAGNLTLTAILTVMWHGV